MVVAQNCECTKCLWIVHFEIIDLCYASPHLKNMKKKKEMQFYCIQDLQDTQTSFRVSPRCPKGVFGVCVSVGCRCLSSSSSGRYCWRKRLPHTCLGLKSKSVSLRGAARPLFNQGRVSHIVGGPQEGPGIFTAAWSLMRKSLSFLFAFILALPLVLGWGGC